MSNETDDDAERAIHNKIAGFLKAHPDVERVEAIFPTINNINRGKWVPAKDAAKKLSQGLRLPVSTYALDSWGIDVDEAGLGIVNGDPDGVAYPVLDSLSLSQANGTPAAQVLMMMNLRDQSSSPCPYDPRQQLVAQVEKLNAAGLSATVALELEFYLLKPLSQTSGKAEPFLPTPVGNLNNLDHMIHFDGVLSDVRRACEIQNVDADVVIGEAGMCQFEINFKHCDDPLRACDQAVLFKRIVKQCAANHGMLASFMAKPFGEDLGSGMHMHVSLLDKAGQNRFAKGASETTPSPTLVNAVGGLLDSMHQFQAIFAPNLNSFRRLHGGEFAPNLCNWGIDHRAAAVRIPEYQGVGSRLEHRICGADANPYLSLASVLAGIMHGLEKDCDPGPPIGDKNVRFDKLNHDWLATVELFENSNLVRNTFGKEFQNVYSTVRKHEISKLLTQVSDVETALYLADI